MKRQLFLAAVAAVTLVACDSASQSNAPVTLDSEEQRISYGMGAGLGKRAQQDDIAINVDAFAAGMRDALAGNTLQMSQEEIVSEMQAYQQKKMAEQQADFTALAEANLAVGEAFLAENAQQEGVVTLDSGLQYKVIEQGDGKTPKTTDVVEVNYIGTLVDGTVFDNSYERGEPVSFPLDSVIPGWTEALQLMPVGSKWQLVIPANLAYGAGGAGGGPIGPNATLLFDVELLDVQDDNE